MALSGSDSDAQVTTLGEKLARKERLIIGTGLLVIALLSWVYLLSGAGTGMSTWAMSTGHFPPPVTSHNHVAEWQIAYWGLMLVMWWVMMIAMMIPGAAPMVLLYARVLRHAQRQGDRADTAIPTAYFMLGYLCAWLLFSAGAVGMQWLLELQGILHAMLMWSTDTVFSASLLLAAGLYQLSPVKQSCLRHCRSPADFLSSHWRDGRRGALRMGLDHGWYCVGCCWLLMALLVAGGVMNLVWIAGLAVVVLLEKLLPRGEQFARLCGVLLIFAGLWLLLL
jgi:predicted metal-binding membrane protein